MIAAKCDQRTALLKKGAAAQGGRLKLLSELEESVHYLRLLEFFALRETAKVNALAKSTMQPAD
jgi:hypothetical protein